MGLSRAALSELEKILYHPSDWFSSDSIPALAAEATNPVSVFDGCSYFIVQTFNGRVYRWTTN